MNQQTFLAEKALQFSLQLYDYYQWLVAQKRDFVIPRQILRSGTSVGANLHESIYACSRADFIAKLHIALKEASETEYWFIILEKTGQLPDQFSLLKDQCSSITRILIAALKTAKKTKTKEKEEYAINSSYAISPNSEDADNLGN